ncbi:MAG: hypothetical protein J0J04_04875 [Microbacterium sp.]|uniref:hypothetical protein n=1 Tax=Microbacterium sp. TaxID=51671 RepID=UPI001AC7BF33|nr:hypothetical protein [Microbacterium sp.]MBN9214142.1 hypothetical protein [Microbacterium sp.]
MTATAVAGVRYLTSRTEVADFVSLLRDRQLLFPAVVVSRPSHLDDPYFPLSDLHAAVDHQADVYYVDAPNLFREVLRQQSGGEPSDTFNVYGGAARVFPAGQWQHARVFTARSTGEGEQRVRSIVAHLKELSGHRGSLSYSTTTPAHDEVRRQGAAIRALDLAAENVRLTQQVASLEAEAARSKPAAPKSRAMPSLPGPARTARRLFSDAEQEIRFRVTTLWAESTTPQEKDDAPLPDFTVGDQFAASVDAIAAHNAALLDKIARAVLKLLLGNDRDGHKLGPVRPEDGGVAWRSYVEQFAPSARRLHYWRIPGGEIELSRVVLHDDYQP